MLDESHFQFLPFYGSKYHFGYTNKDLMISFINSIPEIAEHVEIEDNDEEDEKMEEKGDNIIDSENIEEEEEEEEKELQDNIRNLTNICLLLSIGVKFITSIHEFVIHLAYAYLHFFSNKNLDSDSFKEYEDEDGGFSFERILNGGKKFESLDIISVVVLLDGVSCQKNLSDFQKDLNGKLSIKDLKKRIMKGKIGGFLKDFLDKYPINFDYFKEGRKNPKISCRSSSGIRIYMNRAGSCSYGGGKAIKNQGFKPIKKDD